MVKKTIFSSKWRLSALLLSSAICFFLPLSGDPDSPARAGHSSVTPAPPPAPLCEHLSGCEHHEQTAAKIAYIMAQYVKQLEDSGDYPRLYAKATAEEGSTPSLVSVLRKRVQELMEKESLQKVDELMLARSFVELLLEEALLGDPGRIKPTTQCLPPIINYFNQLLVARLGLGLPQLP